jgi:hypothetical protein
MAGKNGNVISELLTGYKGGGGGRGGDKKGKSAIQEAQSSSYGESVTRSSSSDKSTSISRSSIIDAGMAGGALGAGLSSSANGDFTSSSSSSGESISISRSSINDAGMAGRVLGASPRSSANGNSISSSSSSDESTSNSRSSINEDSIGSSTSVVNSILTETVEATKEGVVRQRSIERDDGSITLEKESSVVQGDVTYSHKESSTRDREGNVHDTVSDTEWNSRTLSSISNVTESRYQSFDNSHALSASQHRESTNAETSMSSSTVAYSNAQDAGLAQSAGGKHATGAGMSASATEGQSGKTSDTTTLGQNTGTGISAGQDRSNSSNMGEPNGMSKGTSLDRDANSISSSMSNGIANGIAMSEGTSISAVQPSLDSSDMSMSSSMSSSMSNGIAIGSALADSAPPSQRDASANENLTSTGTSNGSETSAGKANVISAIEQHLETHNLAESPASLKETAASLANLTLSKIDELTAKGADLAKEALDLSKGDIQPTQAMGPHGVSLQTLDQVAQSGLSQGGLHELTASLGSEALGQSHLQLADKVGTSAVAEMAKDGFPTEKVAAIQDFAKGMGEAAGVKDFSLSKLESLEFIKEANAPENENRVAIAETNAGKSVTLGFLDKAEFAKNPMLVGAEVSEIKEMLDGLEKTRSQTNEKMTQAAAKEAASEEHAAEMTMSMPG